MNKESFDQLSIALATGRSRRQLLRNLIGGSLGLVAVPLASRKTTAQNCAGIQESCADLDCCTGYGCNEDSICIAAAECAALGEGCLTDEQCCGGYFCGETDICIASAECAALGQVCKIDGNCCDDLVCGADGLCAVVSLPDTGAGAGSPPSGHQVSLIAAAAAAALVGGRLLRNGPDSVTGRITPAAKQSGNFPPDQYDT